MKILVSETVTHKHLVELSDELNLEEVLNKADAVRSRYDTGYDALEAVLEAYKIRYGEAFDYEVKPNFCGAKCESIDYDRTIEE